MRTTLDLPDALFRQTKSAAALRGLSMKDLIVRSIERELNAPAAGAIESNRVKLPLVPSKKGRKIDLRGFDLDALLS